MKKAELSEQFVASIEGLKGCDEAKCSFCGRMHYTENMALDENEASRRKDLTKSFPDGHIMHPPGEAVRAGYINNDQKSTVVIGCPCGKLLEIEQWIWANRLLIENFLKTKSSAELERVEIELREITLP